MGYYVFCSVVKNGFTLLDEKKAVLNGMKLSVGSSFRDSFKIKFIKQKNIVNFKIKDKKLVFEGNSKKFESLGVSGWYLNESEECLLQEGSVVSENNFVNIKVKDIEIFLKLQNIDEKVIARSSLKEKENKKTKFHFYRQKEHIAFEYKFLSLLICIACIGTVLFCMKGYKRNTNLYNLDKEILYRIISPDSVYLMPELAQYNLDRKHLLVNTLNYYTAYAEVFLNIDPSCTKNKKPSLKDKKDICSSYVFSNTRQRYKKMYEDYYSKIENIRLGFLNEKTKPQVKYKIEIPVIIGQTVSEIASQAILKEWVMHKALSENLEKKRSFKKKSKTIFDSDYMYSYEEYPTETQIPLSMKQSEEASESLGKISPFGLLSGENRMYQEAGNLSSLVQNEQEKYLKSKLEPIGSIVKVELKKDFDFISYSNGVNFALSQGADLDAEYIKKLEQLSKKPVVTKVVVQGKLDSKIVDRVVREHSYEINFCYEKALRGKEDLEGQMVLSWLINERGRVESIRVEKTDINDKNLIGCIKEKIASWSYPYPQGGSVRVSYPFKLSVNYPSPKR